MIRIKSYLLLLFIMIPCLTYSTQDTIISKIKMPDTLDISQLSNISITSQETLSVKETKDSSESKLKESGLDVWIKRFSIIGSILAIIAFFLNIFYRISSFNKNKWEKLNEHIDEIILTNICINIDTGSHIRCHDLGKVDDFIAFIRHDNEILHFKSFLKNKYKPLFLEFKQTYQALRNIVQVPFWEIQGEKIWMPNKKEYFDTGHTTENDKKYRDDVVKACKLAKKMENVFKKIEKMANKLF